MYSVLKTKSTGRALNDQLVLMLSCFCKQSFVKRGWIPNPCWIAWQPGFRKRNKLRAVRGSFFNQLACLCDGAVEVEPDWLGLSDCDFDCWSLRTHFWEKLCRSLRVAKLLFLCKTDWTEIQLDLYTLSHQLHRRRGNSASQELTHADKTNAGLRVVWGNLVSIDQ